MPSVEGKRATGCGGWPFAGRASLAAGLPLAVAGWLVAPAAHRAVLPAVRRLDPRRALVAALRPLWGLSPAAQVLGSLKAWPQLAAYVAVTARRPLGLPLGALGRYEPLEGVARGNLVAAAVTRARLALARASGDGALPRTTAEAAA